MGKFAILLGLAFIIFGIYLHIKQNPWFLSLGSIIFGLALIQFHDAENKIEQRKDLKE